MIPLKMRIRLLYQIGIAAASTALLSACASMPHVKQPELQESPPPETVATPEALLASKAGRLAAEGLYLGAAKDYVRAAAQSQGSKQLHYLLKAAQSSLKGHRPQVAILLSGEILRLSHESSLRGNALWVQARGYLDEGKTAMAKGSLEELLTISSVTPAVRAQAMGHLSTIYLQENHDLTALDFLVRRDGLLDGTEKAANRQKIHSLLNAQSQAKLKNWQGRSGNPLVQEWLAFELIARQHAGPAGRQAAFQTWLAQHPGHPAIRFSSGTARISPLQSARGDVCILLPDSRKFAPLSHAFEAGLETGARIQAGPPVYILPGTGNPSFTAALYEKGIRAGCLAFVGPSLAQNINAVLGVRRPGEPPILTLGAHPAGLPKGVYRFLPDRRAAAEQIASQAYAAGYRQAAVLYPQNASGASIQAGFITSWKKLGGAVTGVGNFSPSGNIQADTIRKTVSSLPRKKGFIFLVARGKTLAPILRLIGNSGKHAPIFLPAPLDRTGVLPAIRSLTSRLYAIDMPWLIAAANIAPQAVHMLQKSLPDSSTAQWRIAGYGLDAYTLITRILAHQTHNPVHGASGTLRWSRGGKIVQEMPWVHIKNGMVRTLPSLPAPGS